MHSVFDKVVYLLQNLLHDVENSDIKVYANHSANLIEEWKESAEDDMWK